MSSTVISICSQLLFTRCVHAGLLSVGLQFIMLFVFISVVNFQLLHPLDWIFGSVRQLFSFYPWFTSIPLILAIGFYGVLLSKQHLSERVYCPSRYRWLVQYGPRKLLFFLAHLLVSYLTAWLYTSYMHTDYRYLVHKSYGQDCLNSYHVFLLGMGTVAGCYYFVTVHMRNDVTMDFPIAKQKRIKNMRELQQSILLQAPVKPLLLTLAYAIVFWIFGGFLRHKLSHVIGVDTDDRLLGIFDVASNGRLLFYAWLLTARIISNMNVMERLHIMLLSEPLPLVVSLNRMANENEQDLTVMNSLSQSNLYAARCLAAKYLYEKSACKNATIRLEIFRLTEPGNRPVNWRSLCDQCLGILRSFTEELTASMQQISAFKGDEPHIAAAHIVKKNTLLAEKLRNRHYNQLHDIRPAVRDQINQWESKESVYPEPKLCERTSKKLEKSMLELLPRIPGIVYFFYEPDGAKTLFLLENAQPVVWMTMGLARLCVASLTEDRYGVVQDDLQEIMKTLHTLKCELDKLNNAIPSLRHTHRNYNIVRKTVHRSLYSICIAFYPYLDNVITDDDDLRQLKTFVYQG